MSKLRFYPFDVLNRSSFNNMHLYLSFSLSYMMSVNDVVYSLITIYIYIYIHAQHVRYHIYVCCVLYMCRYIVRYFSYLLAMLQAISLSKWLISNGI